MKKLILLLFVVLFFGLVNAVCEDNDNDGYGKGIDCIYAAADCDDSNPSINPGKTDICGNGTDEDCSGTDKQCMQCDEGKVFFRCSCQGTITETGYCCNNSLQESQCEACPYSLGETFDCITEQECPGKKACVIFSGSFEFTYCYDNPNDSCPCTENWQCSSWSSCENGKKTRTCNDKNSCKTQKTKPLIQQTCSASETALDASLSSYTIKEKESFTVTVTNNGNPVSNATIQYAGKSVQTNTSGKTILTAVSGYNEIKISKAGFDSNEIKITVIKENTVVCGDNYCNKTENELNCLIDCKKSKQEKDKNNFTEENKGFCGDNYCSETENTGNCFSDCLNPTKPESLAVISGAIMVFILFIIVLIKIN